MTTITLTLMPLFLNRLGSWEIIIIVLVGLLLFGTKRIPDLMRNMGKGVHAFKQGIEDAKSEIAKPVVKNDEAAASTPAVPAAIEQPKPAAPAPTSAIEQPKQAVPAEPMCKDRSE